MYPPYESLCRPIRIYSCALTQMWSYNCKPLTIKDMIPYIAFSVIRIYDI